MLSRRNVYAGPFARRCSSVAQWSRAKVKVASGAAPRNEVYTIRRTPAATAASAGSGWSASRAGGRGGEERVVHDPANPGGDRGVGGLGVQRYPVGGLGGADQQ